jgi:hypothetical protein
MPADLAPVYLDDTRVTLQGDPRPKVAKILQAGGRPTDARIVLESAGGNPLGPDEVVDRTGDPSRPLHFRTAPSSAPTPAARPPGDEAIGGAGGQGAFQSARPGRVQVPGEILRSTETRAPGTSSEQEARRGGNPPRAQRFAESQSFADPVHKGGSPRTASAAQASRPAPPGHIPDGGLRTQEGGSQEGGRTPPRPSTTTASRESLHRASEEE